MKHLWQMRRERVQQTDDWLVTYADTITLLLCLFVVLLSLQIPRSTSQASTTSASPNTQPMARLMQPIGAGDAPAAVAAGRPVPPIDFWAGKEPFPHMIRQTDTWDDDADTADDPAPSAPDTAVAANQAMPAPAVPYDTTVQYDTVVLHGPAVRQPAAIAAPPAPPAASAPDSPSADAAEMPWRGDRITILQFASTAFFDLGSATLTRPGRLILQDMVGHLTSEDYKSYQIAVEGHTDDMPISTAQFQSNWELSAARAAAVVRFFVSQGVPAERLRAAGYADTQPLAPNRHADGSPITDNQARNRRVVIRLEKIERDDTTPAPLASR